jgi:hypothetical protein
MRLRLTQEFVVDICIPLIPVRLRNRAEDTVGPPAVESQRPYQPLQSRRRPLRKCIPDSYCWNGN